MKNFLFAIAAVVLFATTAHAQTLNLAAQIKPNAASENIAKYKFYLDAAAPVDVPTTLDPACACINKLFSVTTTGSHTVKFTAVNTDPLGGPQESAPLSATIQVATLVSVLPSTPNGPIVFIIK